MNPTLSTLAFIGDVGGGEMILVLFVILMLFGGKRLPELARGLGKSVREFKKATAGVEEEIKRAFEEPAPAKTFQQAPYYTPTPPPAFAPPPPAPETAPITIAATTAGETLTPPPAAHDTTPLATPAPAPDKKTDAA